LEKKKKKKRAYWKMRDCTHTNDIIIRTEGPQHSQS